VAAVDALVRTRLRGRRGFVPRLLRLLLVAACEDEERQGNRECAHGAWR
jgi:hypothetical protein